MPLVTRPTTSSACRSIHELHPRSATEFLLCEYRASARPRLRRWECAAQAKPSQVRESTQLREYPAPGPDFLPGRPGRRDCLLYAAVRRGPRLFSVDRLLARFRVRPDRRFYADKGSAQIEGGC